jgi:16S rRNA (cytosine967-C5)-methyltransferase
MERHRHNLPEWLVQPLKDQLGDSFWPLVDTLATARRWTCASTR